MREIHNSASAQFEADATVVFDLIADIGRLPQWNAAIENVVAKPERLVPGAEWTVQMHPAKGMRWKSVSTLGAMDHDLHVLSYRTVNADGNPSYSLWSWTVTPVGSVVDVLVRWDVFLRTWDRRWLAGPVRRRQLRKEVAGSLRALAALV
jgi:hypothetical protein